MNKVKDFIKKYHIIPYVIIIIGIVVLAYVVKWYHYPEVYHYLREEAYVLYDYFNVILAIALLGFTAVYALVVTKASVEKIYLAGAIASGLLFMLIVPPLAAADEGNHMLKCYDVSNVFLGYEDTGDEKTHWMRECDANTGLDKEISIENYYYTAKNLFTTADSEEMVIHRVDDLTYENKDILYYFPAILGITLGRAFGLSDVAVLMLGRLFTLAACIVVSYFALKKMPILKTPFALVLLMPSIISRAAAITYDGLLVAYIFFFVAYVMYYVHNKTTIKVMDAVLMALTGVALTVGKGGAYVPFLLLLFLIPKENFGTKIKYPIIVASSILICLLAYCLCNLSLFTDIADSTKGATNDLAWTEDEGYTLKYIITHPAHSVKLFGKTLLSYGYQWYGEMIGDGYGWLQIYISPLITLAYTAVIGIASLNVNGEEHNLCKKTRYTFLGVVVFSSLLVILSMWIFWTPLNYGIIAGVQGRYFVPMMMLMVLLLKNKTAIIKKDTSKLLMLASYLLMVVSCFNIWIEC